MSHYRALQLVRPQITMCCQRACTSAAKWDGQIPMDRVQVKYARGSYPGGAGANSSSSRAEVRFRLEDADWLAEPIRERLLAKYIHRLNNNGEFIVRSERTRERQMNLADCLDKIRFAVRELEAEIDEENRQPEPEEVARLEKKRLQADRRRLVEKRRKSLDRRQKTNAAYL